MFNLADYGFVRDTDCLVRQLLNLFEVTCKRILKYRQDFAKTLKKSQKEQDNAKKHELNKSKGENK